MFPLVAYKDKLGVDRMKKIAGVTYELKWCIKVDEKCKKVGKKCDCCCQRTGVHKDHWWHDAAVEMSAFTGKSEGVIKEVVATLKLYNVEVAYVEILKKYKPSELAEIWYKKGKRERRDWDLISEALDYAEENYFINGQPKNLTKQYNSTSYGKLLKTVTEEHKKIMDKAFYASVKQREREVAAKSIREDLGSIGNMV